MIGFISPYYYAATVLAVSCIVNILKRIDDVVCRGTFLVWEPGLLTFFGTPNEDLIDSNY